MYMDWNLSPCKAAPKIMVMRADSANPMAAMFYPRSNLSGLEDHNNSPVGLLYNGGGFEGSDQESVDVEVSDHEALHHVEKKRRLTVEQVRSLELNFELENKLEPERKKQLAHELGLQPRQVAVWFQNRRARWKTKQLERDYDTLKTNYDALLSENKKLQAEIANLVATLEAKNPPPSNVSSNEDTTTIEHKLVSNVDIMSDKTEEQEAVAAAAGKPLDDMDVVASKPKAEKEGSPCSDGYTSEILDADAVAVVEENVLPSEHAYGPLIPAAAAGAATAALESQARSLKEEPDGMVYDPQSNNQLVAFKFEDGLFYEESNSSPSYYYLPEEHGFPIPWWT